ncbi:MAG: CapA family protein [Rhodospirillaceae bacterium]|nr:CapA family protein [Rhodospirillaceae bacterium]
MIRFIAFAALGGLAAVAAVAQTDPIAGPQTEWSLAAVGDVIMNRRVAPFDQPGDPAFHELANLVRAADAAFLNLEQSTFRLAGFDGWPAAERGGNYEVGPPETLIDLQAMGFDLYNQANNHTTDYGVAGLRATIELLDEMGLVHSGAGENLGWASRPGYLDTAKGRIALIGMASTFQPMSRAGAASPDVMGRPGLNPLRIERRIEASPPTLALARRLARAYGATADDDPSAEVRLPGMTVFPGDRDRVVETVNQNDHARILREVRNATDQADHVVVNSHSHEPNIDSLTPPDWLVDFAREVIDAGAATFVVHGPHRLRGVEIHRGRPIFYSLGNFIFHIETIDPMPADIREQYGLDIDALAAEIYDTRFQIDENGFATTGFPAGAQWYRSVLAVAVFRGSEVVELRFHPIELGWRLPRSQRGTPRLAPPALGREIIEHLAELSAPFGTEIRYEDGVGVWRADAP